MAEALAALGALSSAAQLIELTIKISKTVLELRSNTKNGLGSVLDQVDRVTQFVTIAEAIRHSSSQTEQAKRLAQSCLDDTKRLHKMLLACASSPGDRTGKRFVKAWQWRTRRKEVVELCVGLEERKATLGLAVMEPLSMAGRDLDGGVREIASNLTEIGKKISDIHARGNFLHPGEQVSFGALFIGIHERCVCHQSIGLVLHLFLWITSRKIIFRTHLRGFLTEKLLVRMENHMLNRKNNTTPRCI